MPTDHPLLTVAIPTYNCAHYLPDAIGSIFRQSLEDFEILIIDNASEDNTQEVVSSFPAKHIRYLRNPSNLGSRENGNRCTLNARGKYVRFLCADDVLLDGVLKKQLSILDSREDIALVTCDNFITDDLLNIHGYFPAFPGLHPGTRIIDACLSGMVNYIGGPSNVMFRREQAAGLSVDATYNALSDWKFYLQLLQRGGFANIGAPGYLYRMHPTSDTQVNCPPALSQREHMRLVSEFNGWNPVSCVKAVRIGGPEGWRAVADHWRDACTARGIAMAVRTLPDVVHMHKRWRLGLAGLGKQLSAQLS